MEQTVEFTTSTKLSCSACLPAQIVLCVPVSIDAYAHAESTTGIIYGEVTAVSTQGQDYVYTITYDDEQIVEGQELLAELIQGIFCEGCMTNWMRELVLRAVTDAFCFEDLFLCT